MKDLIEFTIRHLICISLYDRMIGDEDRSLISFSPFSKYVIADVVNDHTVNNCLRLRWRMRTDKTA